MFGTKAKIIDMRYDGKTLLDMCDVFVGSGGSMTSEAWKHDIRGSTYGHT